MSSVLMLSVVKSVVFWAATARSDTLMYLHRGG